MIVAGWSFTNICNLKCKHCYNASGKLRENELNFEEAIGVADKLKNAGVVAVNFGGGECALHPDFIPLCKYLNDIGIKISYTTNGTTYEKIKDNLSLFHDIGVSLDFPDKERHDAQRGVHGTFDKAISTIENLVKNNIDTEIVTCLTSLNCSERDLQDFYDLSKRLDVNYWRLNRFRANGRGGDNKKDFALSHEQLKNAYTFLKRYIPEELSVPEPIFRAAFGGSYYVSGDPSGFTSFRIQANGEVSPSVFLSSSGGNIKTKTVEEIMNSEIFQLIRNRVPNGKCINCPAYEHCKGGDTAASFLENGHFNGPDPMCWINPQSKREVSTNVTKVSGDNWNVHELYLCTLYIPISDRGRR